MNQTGYISQLILSNNLRNIFSKQESRICSSQYAEGHQIIPRQFLFITLYQIGFVDMFLVFLRSYYLFSCFILSTESLAENIIVEGENKLFSHLCHLSGFKRFSMASLICSSFMFLRHLWDIYWTDTTIRKFVLFCWNYGRNNSATQLYCMT